MTEKLYYKDSHLSAFTACVTACHELKKGYGVELDRTAFFPEGGGQPGDSGCIGEVFVKDVHEKNGAILHYTDSPLPVGESFECRLDFEQRLRRMQNHSGEHIFSGITNALHGLDNVGFHMGAECMTLDFNGELSWEELMEIETLANKAVRENIPVKVTFPEGEVLAALQYRSKLELTENVRIVEIAGVDRCACCAPHVERTGEIGIIKVLFAERHRGGVRVSLICGMDALDDYRMKQDNVAAISAMLSAKRSEASKAVARVMAEQEKLKERVALLGIEYAKLLAAGVKETDGNICLFDTCLDEIGQRELVNLLMEKCGGMAAVFCGCDEQGYRYIIGSKHIDLRANSRAINAAIGGKGGGSKEMIQGRAAEKAEAIRSFFIH